MNTVDFYSIGWDSKNQIHSAIKNSINANLLTHTDTNLRRLASTVLEMMDFTNRQVKKLNILNGKKTSWEAQNMAGKDIDHIHRKYAQEIHEKHLEYPLMSEKELAEYLTKEAVKELPKDTDQEQWMNMFEGGKKIFNFDIEI